MPTVAPYGSWTSPISAASVAAGGHPVGGGRFVGDEVWWLELRPTEGGRYAIRRLAADGEPRGRAAGAVERPHPRARVRRRRVDGRPPDGAARVRRVHRPAAVPARRAGRHPRPADARAAERRRPGATPSCRCRAAGEVWCVRERHAADGTITRDIAAVPLDGSAAADDPSAIRSVVSGSHFLAGAAALAGRPAARLDRVGAPADAVGRHRAARRASSTPTARCGPHRTLLGSTTESVLQPEWIDDEQLYAISDVSGFWNLYRVGVGRAERRAGRRRSAADFGGPLWQLGARGTARWPTAGCSPCARSAPTRWPSSTRPPASTTDVDLGDIDLDRTRPGRRRPGAARRAAARRPRPAYGCSTSRPGRLTDVRLALDDLPDADYLPGRRSR